MSTLLAHHINRILSMRRPGGQRSYRIIKGDDGLFSRYEPLTVIQDWALFDDYEKVYQQIIDHCPVPVISIDLDQTIPMIWHPYITPHAITIEHMKDLSMFWLVDLPFIIWPDLEEGDYHEAYDLEEERRYFTRRADPVGVLPTCRL